MAVLIEAISVIVRRDALLKSFGNNWERFKQTVPNETMCADDELIRVGFMTPQDVKHYVNMLQAKGLKHLQDGKDTDVVVVDQMHGPLSPCDWIEFGHVSLDGNAQKRIAVCRLKGSALITVMTPDGWQFESSLSASYSFVPSGATEKALKFLRNENGLDVYWSTLSGKEVYVGRTNRETS